MYLRRLPSVKRMTRQTLAEGQLFPRFSCNGGKSGESENA
jgi:hypothetical protein